MVGRVKRVSLFGFGITTKALGTLIQNSIFYDDNAKEPYVAEGKFLVRPSKEFEPDFSDLEIPSPGIPPHHPLIQNAKNLISEYDYFKDVMNFKIWISGTNGKTTTTQMTQHLLADKGALAGGNIGTPLAQLDQSAPIWVLETSSFTLHYTQKATPNIYVLLPISPDHLSWHGGMQAYEADKLKPLTMMDSHATAIVPQRYANIQTKAKLITYKDAEDLARKFKIDTTQVNFQGAFLLDALLAMAVKKMMFDEIDYEGINSFTLDAHRQEEITDSQGRLWVNDTKATNIDATVAAVKRYEEHFIHLILGGDDKGVDLEPLFRLLKTKQLRIYAVGSNNQKIASLAKRYAIVCDIFTHLSDALPRLEKNLQKGEVALLSPAAASLDQFSSYAERGELFKSFVASHSSKQT